MNEESFWVISQPNIDGICSNWAQNKAYNQDTKYPDYPDTLSADNLVYGCLKIGGIRPSLSMDDSSKGVSKTHSI